MQSKKRSSFIVLILMSLAALIICPQAPQQNYTAAGILFWALQIDSLAARTQSSRDLIGPPDSAQTDSTGVPADTIPGFADEKRFARAARCDSPMPGTVRGMLIGRYDEPGEIPVDTPLVGALIQLIVTPVDSAGGKYFDRLATTAQGQYFFPHVPRSGHYEIEALHKVIRDFRYTISTGFIQDIGKRCLLPSKDGRVPLSRYQRDVLKEKGLL